MLVPIRSRISMMPQPGTNNRHQAMTRSLRLLLIEDSEEDAELLLAEIENSGFNVSHVRVESAKAIVDALAEHRQA